MWLGNEVFQHLERAARVEAVSAGGQPPHGARAPASTVPPGSVPRRYRPCPICSSLMHRRNYGRKSGVILDTCHQHGLWFDQGELDSILDWIRQGGMRRAEEHLRQMEAEEARSRAALARDGREPELIGNPLSPRRDLGDFVDGILRFLGR